MLRYIPETRPNGLKQFVPLAAGLTLSIFMNLFPKVAKIARKRLFTSLSFLINKKNYTMPVYEYLGLNPAGKTLKGIIDADNAAVARQKLRGDGIFPVDVKETTSKVKGIQNDSVSFFRRVRPKDVYAFTRQLSTLLGAGVPLVASLDALLSQSSNQILKKIIAQVKESVNQGNSLASALSQHPKTFSNLYVNMVHSGESSGSLDVVLERLAEFGENQQALRGRFKAALAYPLFMSLIGILVLFFLITFIVPNITKVFVEMHHTLPLPTLILINVSNFMLSFWWVFVLILIGLLVIVKRAVKRPKFHYIWDNIKLRLPVFGTINQKIALAQFARALGSLIQSGVPLLSSMQIVRNIVNNVLIAGVIDNAIEEIREGKSLAGTLSKSPWFTSMAV
ncbi:MAG: type II secretion system F family protein, partial [Deltaproteobacteria bacterium]|nr:type II secretion system F family protein [Deltaproteobacteria bacterium]